MTRSRHRAVVLARQPIVNRATFPHHTVRSLATAAALTGALGRRPLGLALAAATAGYRAEVVHVHFGYPVADVLGAARRRRLPVVLSLHGHDATSLPPAHYAEAVDAVDAVVVPSQFLATHAERLGFPSDRTHVIPAGIDTELFSATPLPEGPPEALFVGRLVAKKGIDVLLDAWPAVRDQVPDARLRVIGAGPLEHLLESPPDGVVHEPPDPARRATQVRDAIRRSALVVQPSRTAGDGDAESLLLVNLEAQASGRPLVTTRHGGIPEFVAEGTTTVLVAEGDGDELAHAVAALLGDPDRSAALGAAGPAWAETFDVAACTERIDALYDAVLAAR